MRKRQQGTTEVLNSSPVLRGAAAPGGSSPPARTAPAQAGLTMKPHNKLCVQKTLLAFAVVIISLTKANADDQNVQGLYNLCKATTDHGRYAVCVGYISGIGDIMQTNGVMHPGAAVDPAPLDERLCGRPSYGAQVQAFMNWAEKHPQQWQAPRQLGVLSALSGTWPCPGP
jgi:hypothetical protein